MNNQFNILALSGGGFRGLYTATVLARLEEQAGKPIAQCFDLICGTSVGGIIAMALALEKPAQDIAKLMEKQGSKIFPGFKRLLPSCLPVLFLFNSKYRNNGLKRMVDDELFGNYVLGDSRHRLLIPALNYSTGSPQFFKTPHHESLREDYKRKMSDIAMATSAAPVFFPIYQPEDVSSRYVDGGLVGNAPGLFGVHEAQHFCGQAIEDVHVLSVGTMGGEFRIDTSKSLNKGIIGWGEKLFLLTVSAQEKTVDFVLRHQLGKRYHLIDELPTREQEKNIGLDVANKAAIQTLKSMGEESAKRFIGKPEADDFLFHVAEPFNS